MKKINDNESQNIKGGAGLSIWAGICIAALTVFVSGIIEGITNPERCKE